MTLSVEFLKWRRLSRCAFSVCLAIWFANGPAVDAGEIQQAEPATPRSSVSSGNSAQDPANNIVAVRLGFQGEFRLGEWAPIRVEVTPALASKSLSRLRIWGRDGDDRPVCDDIPIERDPEVANWLRGCFRLGRSVGDLMVQVLDDRDQVVAQQVIALEPGTAALSKIWSPTSKLVGLVGIAPAARDKFPRSARDLGDGDSLAYLYLDEPSQLPTDAVAYRNLDTLIVAVTDLASWKSVSPRVVAAWKTWLESGGRLCLWAGPEALSLLQPGELLGDLCPGGAVELGELKGSAKLEFFVNAKVPLLNATTKKLSLLKVSPDQSSVVLQQDDIPILIRQPQQFGVLTFLTLPLDQPPLADWPGSTALVEQLASGIRSPEERGVSEAVKGQAAHEGYRDLVGQLRVPLEQFARVSLVNFSTVALLAVLFIVLVGPVDYFLLRRILGRPHFTWITFPVWVLVFSLLAWWIGAQAKPLGMQVNQLEIINLDGRTGHADGALWNTVYSPQAVQADVSISSTNTLGKQIDKQMTTWMGQPGSGFGGMQSPPSIRTAQEPYVVLHETSPSAVASTKLIKFPFPVSSVAAFQTEWSGQLAMEVRSRLKSGQTLSGTFTNPLPVALRNCQLYFENGVYVFEKPVAAGETIDVVEAKRRLGKSFITRRVRTSSEKQENSPWNVAEANLRRIADMLMLHDLAGGQGYTSLSHRYLPQLDTSDLFEEGLGQAVLVAELEQPVSQLNVGGQSMSDQYDQHVTIIRIVLPVELPSKK